MVARAATVILGLILAAGCGDRGSGDAGPRDSGTHLEEAGIAADAEAPPDAGPPSRDAAPLVDHDAGPPLACTNTCGCPQGLGCINGACRSTGAPIYCCRNPGCPAGQVCLTATEQPDVCPSPTPDAGPRPDSGPGGVGAACEGDTDCDQTLGMTCWERHEPPGMWGYCTVENCTFVGCPAGSECLQFNDAQMTTGCLKICSNDPECDRDDAFCFPLQGAPFPGVCLTSCKDDLLDCGPRNGTVYCDRASGRCEPTPAQMSGVAVGAACQDNRSCGPGQICMGEFAWGLPGGLCSRVCTGLPEATPCGANELCLPFAGVGMCFRACTNGACPNRPGAVCGILDPAWPTPACLPQ